MNDDYQKALIESVWFTKSMPRRRGGRHAELINTDDVVNLDTIKTKLHRTERLYTSCMEGA